MKFISRDILPEFKHLLKEYPVVTVLGPRQSGKTTLAKKALPEYDYSNLELPDVRHFARQDPRAFLAQFKKAVIIDEIQRVPELLSFIQSLVDEKKQNGLFVLTGSHQLKLTETMAQSLAGRTGILTLLPLSINELSSSKINYPCFEAYAYKGFLPRVYDQNQRPRVAYSNYYQTYVERDVRQLIKLKDLSVFEKFMKLLSGRVGQLMDYASLGRDCGVDQKTIKNWLSILEASFIVFKLNPYFKNFGKRMVKASKYYFIDVGLLVYLLGIEKEEQISRDPLMGSIFENLIIIEFLKKISNQGKRKSFYFLRDSNGNEIDIIFQRSDQMIPIEIKASSTYHPSLISNFSKIARWTGNLFPLSYLIYNGNQKNLSHGIHLLPFTDVNKICL